MHTNSTHSAGTSDKALLNRLRGRRIPVWSYLKRKLQKRANELRTRWRLARRPPRVRLAGVSLPIDRAMYSDKIIRRLYDGGYEREERDALRRTLKDNDVVVELGTGIGYMSTVAARMVGDDRVTTYEANAALLPAIEKVHRMNGVRPAVHHGVMTPNGYPETLNFYRHTKNFWSSSLTRPEKDYEIVHVPTLAWPAELKRLQPTYVIMDIEGGEIELLEDFESPSVRRMLIEFHPGKTGQASVERVIQHLKECGFAAARVDPGAQIFYFER